MTSQWCTFIYGHTNARIYARTHTRTVTFVPHATHKPSPHSCVRTPSAVRMSISRIYYSCCCCCCCSAAAECVIVVVAVVVRLQPNVLLLLLLLLFGCSRMCYYCCCCCCCSATAECVTVVAAVVVQVQQQHEREEMVRHKKEFMMMRQHNDVKQMMEKQAGDVT